MVMQGYDFVELHRRYGTILQMGGSDQWGNIINGVDLAHKADQTQLYALTAPLLLNSAGEKMGKTVNGAVWLNRNMLSSYDYWQYFRNVDDADVGTLLRRFTTLPMDEVRRLEALQGSEINEAKKILAFEATKICRGEQDAIAAAETARKTFEQGGAGDNLPSIIIDPARLDAGVAVVDLMVEAGLAASKGEARRLIEGGGARYNDAPVPSPAHMVSSADMTAQGYIKLSAGKKKHALIKAA
jgi:tyrosyl-tRNA synthetase